MEIITADLSLFGRREIRLAADLLSAYCSQQADFLSEGLTLNVNLHSGFVFLSDQDYQVAMLDSAGKLRQWFYCPNCGCEGFEGDRYYLGAKARVLKFEKYQGYCSRKCLKQG